MQDIKSLQNFFAISYKPPNISSLSFASAIKAGLKRMWFPVKKIGFSGTLDPFAQGTLLLGINNYTKLLPHLEKSHKTYKAVLFLGLESRSLDVENVVKIHKVEPLSNETLHNAIKNICGKIRYKPPKFSAKHINGVRAYTLMRQGIDFETKEIETEIFSLKILNYSHPFFSFEICMSEGGYVRSIGEMIAQNLNVCGSLCSLERTQEGMWNYKNICMSDFCSDIYAKKLLQRDMQHKAHKGIFGYINVPIQVHGINQNAKVILLSIKNALKYDTIRLTEYAKVAYNGAKFMLNPSLCEKIFVNDSHNADDERLESAYMRHSQMRATHLESGYKNKGICPTQHNNSGSKVMLADFDTHFGIIEIFRDGRVNYILNRIDKC